MKRKHNHYFKDVRNIDVIDVYRVLLAFQVTDPCIQHAVKKLLVAGGRGAGKDISQDIKEAIDSLERWQEMRTEEGAASSMHAPASGVAQKRSDDTEGGAHDQSSCSASPRRVKLRTSSTRLGDKDAT